MVRKKGTDLELVVAAIEKALNPDAHVLHDQFLPVLTSCEGRKRQCDVVIYSGTKQRPIVTIVEVQDRNSSVSIATFDGWLVKRDEVGANKLICISRKPYSKSVIEKARQQGDRVLLIELKTGIPDELPINFIRFRYKYENLTVSKDIDIHASIPTKYKDIVTPEGFTKLSKIEWKETLFINSDKKHVSLYDSIVEVLEKVHPAQSLIHKGSCCLSFLHNKSLRLFIEIGGQLVQVYLSVELDDYVYENHDFYMDVAVYGGLDSENDGWIFEANHETYQGSIKVKVPVVKDEASGGYKMLNIIHSAPFESSFTVSQME